jgi:hypothetical protein
VRRDDENFGGKGTICTPQCVPSPKHILLAPGGVFESHNQANAFLALLLRVLHLLEGFAQK